MLTSCAHRLLHATSKRIESLEQTEKDLQDKKKEREVELEKVKKDLENCRVDGIKQVAKAREEFAKSMDEMTKRYGTTEGQKNVEHEAMKIELKQLREQNKGRLQLEIELKLLQEQIVSDTKTKNVSVQELKQEINTLQDQCDNGNKMKDQLERSLKEEASESESLRQMKQQLESKLQESVSESESLCTTAKSLEVQVEDMKQDHLAQVETFRREKKELQDQIARNEKSSGVSVQELKQELETVRGLSHVNDTIKHKLETTLQEKQKIETTLQEESDSLRHSVESLEAQINTMKKDYSLQVDTLTLERNELCDKIISHEKASNKSIQDLEQEIESFRQLSSASDKTKGELESSLNKATSESESLRQTVKYLTSQVDNLKQEVGEAEEMKKKLKECEEKLELSLQRQSSLLEDNTKRILSSYSTKQLESSNNSDYDEVVQKLDKKVKSERVLRGELAQKKQMIGILESNEKHMEEHIASLEEQINKLVEDYEARLLEE